MTDSPDAATSPPTPPPTAETPAGPTTPPRRPRRPAPPLFTGTPPTPPPDAPTTPEQDTPPDPRGSPSGSASASPEGDKPKRPRQPVASSVSPTDRRQLKKAIAAAVRTIGGRLNALSGDEVARDAGVWIPTSQDEEGIAEPGSTLVARHIDLAVNPDLADMLAILIALADYASKNFDLKARIRRARKAGAVPTDTTGPMGEAPPPPSTGAAA